MEIGENMDLALVEAAPEVLSSTTPEVLSSTTPETKTKRRAPKVPWPEAAAKKKRRAPKVLRPEAGEKKKTRKRRCSMVRNTVDIWAAQCKECLKWRVIPTQEEYEEIRNKSTEEPFTCNRKHNISCDDPSDLDYDCNRIWVIDKPNLPKTPKGFKRALVLRKDYSKMDCYYVTPDGKNLRALTEVAKFLGENPEYKDLSVADFSFSTPKIKPDTIPRDVAGENGSSDFA